MQVPRVPATPIGISVLETKPTIPFHTHIGATGSGSVRELRELWRFRELLLFLAWRDIKVRYKQTVIGAAWAILQPLMMMLIFTVFLGRIGKLPSGDVPYPLFVFSGLLPWTFFATSIANAGNSVVGSEKLITKIYFPRLIIPIAAVGPAVVDVAIASTVLLAMMVWYGIALTPQLLLLPVAISLIASAALGIGTLLAALNVSYRDFRYVIPFLIQVWMFATPTVYMRVASGAGHEAVSGFDRWIAIASQLNPMTPLVASFRSFVLGTPVDGTSLLLAAVTSLAALLVGVGYFLRTEHRFADIV